MNRNRVHFFWLAAIAVLVLVRPAAAQQPSSAPSSTTSLGDTEGFQKAVGWGIAVGMALQGGDAMQTAYCLGQQQCKEGNPVLAPFEDHPFWFGFTKLGIATGISYAAIRLRKPYPYWAALIVGAEIALETYAVIHNNALFPPSGNAPAASMAFTIRFR